MCQSQLLRGLTFSVATHRLCNGKDHILGVFGKDHPRLGLVFTLQTCSQPLFDNIINSSNHISKFVGNMLGK
jgi:hypothetical protein